jgi:hypothetical protein
MRPAEATEKDNRADPPARCRPDEGTAHWRPATTATRRLGNPSSAAVSDNTMGHDRAALRFPRRAILAFSVTLRGLILSQC